MTFMMTSSNYDKSDFVNFFIKTYSILSIQYMYKISCKMDKNFLRYTMFFHRGPTSWSYFWTSYVHSIYVMCPDTFRISSEHIVYVQVTPCFQGIRACISCCVRFGLTQNLAQKFYQNRTITLKLPL